MARGPPAKALYNINTLTRLTTGLLSVRGARDSRIPTY
jgi:hypothetical protein